MKEEDTLQCCICLEATIPTGSPICKECAKKLKEMINIYTNENY